MAEEIKKLQVNIEGKDNTGKAFKSASQNASLFKKDLGGINNALAKVGGMVASLYALGGAISFIGGSIAEYDEKIQYATKLEYLLKKTTDATDAQVKSLLDQASALQEVGVVSDDVAVALQGQLATFELSTETIRKMTPAILDMVVAEKGINATTQDMIEFGNAFGMSLEGNYGALTRRGFKLDEATKKIIELGTEEEKATAITKYLTDTYGGLNAQMAETSQGKIVNLQNRFSDFREQIGELTSFFRGEMITAVEELGASFEGLLPDDLTNNWSKKIAKLWNDLNFGVTNIIPLIADRTDSMWNTIFGVENSGTTTFQDDLIKNNEEFEKKWKENGTGIITTNKDVSNSLGDLYTKYEGLDEAESLAKKVKDSFVDMSKKIISSFNDQTTAISKLRIELSDLETDTQKQLDSVDSKYKEDLKNKAKQSQDRIDQIDKEIKETRETRNAGWRTQIAELEAEKEKEKAIIARVGGEVTNLNEELAKDDLTILKEKMEAEKLSIQEEASKTKAEKEKEISQRTGIQLRGVLTSLSPELMDTLTAENNSFLGQIGAGANQYVFNFNGDVNDKDKLIRVITEALNRQATLKGVAGAK